MEEIIKYLQEKGVEKLGFSHLVEVAEPEFDEDGDEYPVVVDAIEIKGGKVIVYDHRDEDWDGNYDPVWDVAELSKDVQDELLYAMKNHEWDVWNN